MKKEITWIEENEHLSDVLVKLGQQTKEAYIYLHENIVHQLEKTSNRYEQLTHSIRLTQNATEHKPSFCITIGNEVVGRWKPVFEIEGKNIAFDQISSDPDEIFFFKIKE